MDGKDETQRQGDIYSRRAKVEFRQSALFLPSARAVNPTSRQSNAFGSSGLRLERVQEVAQAVLVRLTV